MGISPNDNANNAIRTSIKQHSMINGFRQSNSNQSESNINIFKLQKHTRRQWLPQKNMERRVYNCQRHNCQRHLNQNMIQRNVTSWNHQTFTHHCREIHIHMIYIHIHTVLTIEYLKKKVRSSSQRNRLLTSAEVYNGIYGRRITNKCTKRQVRLSPFCSEFNLSYNVSL